MKEVWQAAMSLGYSPETKEKAALSGFPWEKTGYVTVKKMAQRSTVLKGIASEIVKGRQKEAQAAGSKKH
jgi:signal recognition particle subunit SEC65